MELEGVLNSRTQRPPAQCLATARLEQCLGPSDESLLGVTTEHLRAVDPMKGIQVHVIFASKFVIFTKWFSSVIQKQYHLCKFEPGLQ